MCWLQKDYMALYPRIQIFLPEFSFLLNKKSQCLRPTQPITDVARCNTRTLFYISNTGVAGSVPTGGTDVCLSLICVYVGVGRGLRRAYSSQRPIGCLLMRFRKQASSVCRATEERGEALARSVRTWSPYYFMYLFMYLFIFLI
jgi:hypothetical protein